MQHIRLGTKCIAVAILLSVLLLGIHLGMAHKMSQNHTVWFNPKTGAITRIDNQSNTVLPSDTNSSMSDIKRKLDPSESYATKHIEFDAVSPSATCTVTFIIWIESDYNTYDDAMRYYNHGIAQPSLVPAQEQLFSLDDAIVTHAAQRVSNAVMKGSIAPRFASTDSKVSGDNLPCREKIVLTNSSDVLAEISTALGDNAPVNYSYVWRTKSK